MPVLISYDSGIVRGINTFNGVLFLITPVPQISLKKVNHLLQGYIQIPTSLFQVRDPFISFAFFLPLSDRNNRHFIKLLTNDFILLSHNFDNLLLKCGV